jgi:NADPH:quinone reductase
MRALISRIPGPAEVLEFGELPIPQPGSGDLLVRVAACSINYPDVLIIEDKYQFRAARPFAPGSEVSGVVERVGQSVVGWKPGDRLMGITVYGGLAEWAIVKSNLAFALPEGLDAITASALLLTYGTTIYALLGRGALREGETLLVLGAAGGVGLAAVEIGKAIGATVVAAVSSEEKAELARSAGADRTVIYGRSPFDKAAATELAAALKSAVGSIGADVVYDPVGGDYAELALRAIAWEGRFLVIGFVAGIPRLPLNLPLLKSCDVRGVFWGAFTERHPDANRAYVEQLLRWWAEGRIRPRISKIWPLRQGAEAIALMAQRQAIGKLVVSLDKLI